MIIYYERYVVIQAGLAVNAEGEPVNKMDFLTEEEYINIIDNLPQKINFLMMRILINLLLKWVPNV